MKKIIVISSMILLSAIILLGVYCILFSAVTYSGVIDSAKPTDDYIEITIQDEKTDEQITILADEHTDVYYCHLERDIYLGDLISNPGNTVKVSCKRYFNHNKYAETIIVQFAHELE